MELSVYGIRGCGVRKLSDRYLYAFLVFLAGKGKRLTITVRELASRTGLTVGKAFRGLERLERARLVIKGYLYFRLPDGTLSRRLRLSVVTDPPAEVPSEVLFLKLSPEAKGLLISLLPYGRLYFSKSEIAREVCCLSPSAPSFTRAFRELEEKGIIKKERFYYAIELPRAEGGAATPPP